jgi:hypothetical protein
MIIGNIEGATRRLGRPRRWTWVQSARDRIATLPVRDEVVDGVPKMVSAWMPTPDEIARIVAGAPVYLSVIGRRHPPVRLSVGEPPA